MIPCDPQTLEKLRRLSDHLHAMVMVGSTEDFALWHPDIRMPYMCLVTDLAWEVRDAVQGLITAPAATPPAPAALPGTGPAPSRCRRA